MRKITLQQAVQIAREGAEGAKRERERYLEEEAARYADYSPRLINFTCSPPCEHNDGWWTTIPCRVLLCFTVRRRVFVCEDCMDILDAETMERV